jgi:hypothetical protein
MFQGDSELEIVTMVIKSVVMVIIKIIKVINVIKVIKVIKIIRIRIIYNNNHKIGILIRC